MEFKLTNDNGSSGKAIKLSEQVFGQAFNEPLIHQVVTAYMAAARRGTRAHLSRAEVSGGGHKPWKQKGQGRARAGSSRSPLWRGGGKTFAAETVSYEQKVNRKMHQGAMRSILSELVRQERLVVVEDLRLDAPKTKQLVAKLKEFGLDNVLIVTEQPDNNLHLSARNLINVDVRPLAKTDPVSLVSHEKVLMSVGALKKIEELLA
ncbi:MAG: 50S ribosomal protein L4 [Gammaproteobacteria bacterium]|nr:50S ribosomal protein L4 [Gammaproteobacteria bacterium]